MSTWTKVSLAFACALGASAALALIDNPGSSGVGAAAGKQAPAGGASSATSTAGATRTVVIFGVAAAAIAR